MANNKLSCTHLREQQADRKYENPERLNLPGSCNEYISM